MFASHSESHCFGLFQLGENQLGLREVGEGVLVVSVDQGLRPIRPAGSNQSAWTSKERKVETKSINKSMSLLERASAMVESFQLQFGDDLH